MPRPLVATDTTRWWQRAFQRRAVASEPRTVEDGFGNRWYKCDLADCSLQVVRPGKVQCNDERVLTEFGWEWMMPCVWHDDESR